MSVGELIITAEFALMNQMEGVLEHSGSLSKSGTTFHGLSLRKDAFIESVGVKRLGFYEGYAG